MSGAPAGLIEAVELSRDGVVAAVAGLGDAQSLFSPGPGEWSIAEILEHLYLAEMSGISMLWAAASAFRSGSRWTEDRPHRGKHIEEIIGQTWRPREQAPPIAVPHFGGPSRFWRSALCSLKPVLGDLVRALDGLPLDEIIVRHSISGPMDARQRIEFLRFHLERHLLQIHRVVSSSGFPA
jgi:hypothetical protein